MTLIDTLKGPFPKITAYVQQLLDSGQSLYLAGLISTLPRRVIISSSSDWLKSSAAGELLSWTVKFRGTFKRLNLRHLADVPRCGTGPLYTTIHDPVHILASFTIISMKNWALISLQSNVFDELHHLRSHLPQVDIVYL